MEVGGDLEVQLSLLVQMAILSGASDRFPGLFWVIGSIDLVRLLADVGNGCFVEHFLNHGTLSGPDAYTPLCTLPDGKSSICHNKEVRQSHVIKLEHDVLVIFMRLGVLARNFRNCTFENITSRRHEVINLQRLMETLLVSQRHLVDDPSSLPTTVRISFSRALTLSQAFFIYSHTSMWQSQGREVSTATATQIGKWSRRILETAAEAMRKDRSPSEQLLFPVFLAGFASKDPYERQHALTYVRTADQEIFGQNLKNMGEALEAVQKMQTEQCGDAEGWWSINWIHVLKQRNPPAVTLRF